MTPWERHRDCRRVLRAEWTEPWKLELAPPFLPIGGPSPVPVSRGARALPGTAQSSGAARPWALGGRTRNLGRDSALCTLIIPMSVIVISAHLVIFTGSSPKCDPWAVAPLRVFTRWRWAAAAPAVGCGSGKCPRPLRSQSGCCSAQTQLGVLGCSPAPLCPVSPANPAPSPAACPGALLPAGLLPKPAAVWENLWWHRYPALCRRHCRCWR